MPVWLTIILALGGSTFISLAITAIWNWQRRGVQKIQERELRKQDDVIRGIIREELAETKTGIRELSSKIDISFEADTTLLRDRMQCSLNYCRNQGFATVDDKANWKCMLESYRKLGGNHFKEYVNEWEKAMNELPTEPPEGQLKKKKAPRDTSANKESIKKD